MLLAMGVLLCGRALGGLAERRSTAGASGSAQGVRQCAQAPLANWSIARAPFADVRPSPTAPLHPMRRILSTPT
jgi:hypothetical protein